MRLNVPKVAASAALALALFSCSENDLTGPAPMEMTPRNDVVATNGLMITEIMPDPSAVGDGFGEWFELYNGGAAQINLNGYRIVSASGLTASESHTIATNVLIDPGQYIVIGNNANTATNGGVTQAYSYVPATAIQLNNGSSTSANEWLAIRTAGGLTLDSVAYAVRVLPAAPGPYTVPSGSSRGVINLGADNTIISGSSWFTSSSVYGAGDRGTPGEANTGGSPFSVTVRVSWVSPGTSFTVTAQAVDSVGKPTFTNFTWASSDNSIATINPATGSATGVSLGTVTLTATATNGVTGTGPLFVVAPGGVATVSLSMNDPDRFPAGYTKPIFPTVRTTTNATTTVPLVWTSSDNSIATVDTLGYVTGVAAGEAVIRATAPNGVYGSQPVTIIPATAPTTAVYRNHVEFGTPSGGEAGIVLSKPQFITSYSETRGGPNWVSWNLNATQFGAAPRCDCFSADQTLPADVYKVVDFDYRNGGYDRGHMVQSESRTTTDQENASTFLMTNIIPQAGGNNQGPWSRFENALNDMVRVGGKEVYVIAGGLYAASPTTLKNEGKVQIPDFTWKVAVVVDAGEGLPSVGSVSDLQVLAVLMPNLLDSGEIIRPRAWETFKVTVDSIEALTGYDLLANLPDPLEAIVESGTRFPVAAVNGPFSPAEGDVVSLDASASSDPDGDALTYAWEFGDGTTGTGATPTHAYTDNGSYNIQVIVTDIYGAADTATTTATVSNVAPSVAAFSGATLLPGETYTASGSFTDPGTDTWNATVNYGDGSGTNPLTLTGKTFSLSHTYSTPGGYTVSVNVTDDDLDAGGRTATVIVLTLDQALTNLENDVTALVGTLGAGEANALKASLRNAAKSIGKGNISAAVDQLQAFIGKVASDVSAGLLTPAQGAALTAMAQRVIDSIT